MVERGLARSRGHAAELLAAGRVAVGRRPVDRASSPVGPDDDLAVSSDPHSYVSRGALKLLRALDDLALTPSGRALDAGSSTGGFTQVLLERGCDHVVAVDVGHDQLAATLRSDPRVTVREGLHLRDLELHHVDRLVDWAVADVSFVSLTKVLAPMSAVMAPTGTMLLMVKPQFEVGRGRLGSGGVVRDPAMWTEAVSAVRTAAELLGWWLHAASPSRLPGPAGNREFFLHLRQERAAAVHDLTDLALTVS